MIQFLAGLLGVLCIIDFVLTMLTYGDAPAWLTVVATAAFYVAFRSQIKRWLS